VTFSDPDGNGWLLQEITTRFPGRVAGDTTYASAGDLSRALRRAEAAHGKHEARTGQRDLNWPDWYAEYMCASRAAKSCRFERARARRRPRGLRRGRLLALPRVEQAAR